MCTGSSHGHHGHSDVESGSQVFRGPRTELREEKLKTTWYSMDIHWESNGFLQFPFNLMKKQYNYITNVTVVMQSSMCTSSRQKTVETKTYLWAERCLRG